MLFKKMLVGSRANNRTKSSQDEGWHGGWRRSNRTANRTRAWLF